MMFCPGRTGSAGYARNHSPNNFLLLPPAS